MLSVVQIFTNFIGINTKEFCILIFLVAIALSLMLKGVLFKSSNSIWFSLIILSYAIFMFLTIFFEVLVGFYALAFLMLPAIFALLTGLIFKEWIYIKISVFLVAFSVPILLFCLKLLSTWLFVLLLIMFGVAGYLMQMLIKINKND